MDQDTDFLSRRSSYNYFETDLSLNRERLFEFNLFRYQEPLKTLNQTQKETK